MSPLSRDTIPLSLSPLSHPNRAPFHTHLRPTYKYPPLLLYPNLFSPTQHHLHPACRASGVKTGTCTIPVQSIQHPQTHTLLFQSIAFPAKATPNPVPKKMDRLTACSKPLPPTPDDWPLSSHPHPSLVNVPKESKRHCRLLPAGMVNLTLAQMADAVRDEEMTKLKKKNRRQVGMFAANESEGGKCAIDEYELKMKRKREDGMRMRREKKIVIEEDEKVTAVEQQPETMDPVDEQVSSLHHPSDKIIQQPRKLSPSSAAATPTRPPRATTSRTFETAHKTTAPIITITQPSVPNPPLTAHNPSHPPRTTTTTTPHPPITVHTALHSNPPTTTDITHACALTARHSHSHSHTPNRARNTTTTTTLARSRRNRNRNPNTLSTFDALGPYGRQAVVAGEQQQQQRTTLTRYVSKARRTKRALGRVFFGR